MSSPTKLLTRTHALLRATRRRLSRDNGSVLLIVILAMPVIMACAAFAIDVANVWAARQHVQSAADAAALAGAQNMDGNSTDVGKAPGIAENYLTANDATGHAYTDGTDSVTVNASQNVPMFFSGLFGLHDATVTASATATNATSITYASDPNPSTINSGQNQNGWGNYCAAGQNIPGSNSSTLVEDQGGGCSGTGDNSELEPGLYTAAGNVDDSQSTAVANGNFQPGHPTANGTPTVMIDLTGSCVEASHGTGCLQNADGEIEMVVGGLVKGDTYTVQFYLSANTGGPPEEKPMAVAVSSEDFKGLAPMADTTGTSTQYKLEKDVIDGTLPAGTIIAYKEYAYASADTGYGASADNTWVPETLTFTAQQQNEYVAFGSLENCVKDGTSTNPGVFTTSLLSNFPGAAELPSSLTSSPLSYTTIPDQVEDNPSLSPRNPDARGGCRFGAAISDWSVSYASGNGVSLTK